MQIGHRGQSTGNPDTENVHQATDVFVDTQAKEVYAADGYGNKRVIVFDSETGKFKRMWGAFGNPPPPTFAANAAGAASRRRRPTGRRSSACRTPSRCRATASSTSPTASTTASSCSRREGKYLQAGARSPNEGSDVDAGAGRLRVLARSASSSISTSSIRGRCGSSSSIARR